MNKRQKQKQGTRPAQRTTHAAPPYHPTGSAPAIYQTIQNVMRDMGAVEKGKIAKGEKFSYKFRGIDDVMNALHPLLAKYGLFAVPDVLEQKREPRGNAIYTILTVRYTLYAPDGSSVSAYVIGEGMDYGDKSSNKAMSAAYKYAMLQIFSIPTEDMVDPDGENLPPPAQQPEPPKQQQPAPQAPTRMSAPNQQQPAPQEPPVDKTARIITHDERVYMFARATEVFGKDGGGAFVKAQLLKLRLESTTALNAGQYVEIMQRIDAEEAAKADESK